MLEDKEWIFTTATALSAGTGPALINLRTASNFAILAKSKITTTGKTSVVGDIGVSPVALSTLEGLSQTLAEDGKSATSDYVTGKIYAANMKEPTPSILTTAISNMEAAYTDAATRGSADYTVQTGLYGGNIKERTFVPGIYKWDGVVSIATGAETILDGGPKDTWIF